MLETDPKEASGQLIIVKENIKYIIEMKEQSSRSNLNY